MVSKLKSFLRKLYQRFPNGMSNSWGILHACYRCRYAKSHEPILIFSKHRGPRVIVNLDDHTYVRRGDCIGFENCKKCFTRCTLHNNELPCNWIRTK